MFHLKKSLIEKQIQVLKSKYIFLFSLVLSVLFLLKISLATPTIENNPQGMSGGSVDLSGKFNYSYELAIPDGTNGIHPSISLSYSSANAPGVLGLGWNLSGVDWISRDSTYGIDYSANDHYASSMVGSLVQNGPYYYSKKESFMRFSATGTPPFGTSDSWTAVDKSGTTYLFSPMRPNGTTPTVWALTNVTDIYGNSYSVSYSGSQIIYNYQDRQITITFKAKSRTVPIYIYSSPYPDNSIVDSISISAGANLSRVYSFTYSTNVNGEELLSSIDRTDTINGSNTIYTPIKFSYNTATLPSFTSGGEFSSPTTVAIGYIPLSDKSQCLQGIQICQKAGVVCSGTPALIAKCKSQKQLDQASCNAYQATWMNPCTFGIKYPFPFNSVLDVDRDGKQEFLHMVGSERNNDIHLELTRKNANDNNFTKTVVSGNFPGFQYKTFFTLGVGDVNGDGSPDFAYSDGNILQVAFFNKATGQYNPPTAFSNVSVPYGRDDYVYNTPDLNWKGTLVDMNADGLADYVKYIDTTHIGIYLSNQSSFANVISVDVGAVLRDQGNGPELGQFMDINGDGRPELVYIIAGNIQTRIFAKDFSSSYPVDYSIANVGDSLNRWFTDLNSDGKTDLVVLTNNQILQVYYFDGRIFKQGSDIPVAAFSEYSTSQTSYRKFFADVNEDGIVDYIRYGSDNAIHVSYGTGNGFNNGDSSGNNGFSQPAKSLWNIADLNGDGRPDFISMKSSDPNNFLEKQATIINYASDMVSKRLASSMSKYMTQLNISSVLSGGALTAGLSSFSFTSGLSSSFIKAPNTSPAVILTILSVLSSNPDPPINTESKVEVYFQNPRVKENLLTQVDGGFGRTVSANYTDCKARNGADVASDALGRIQFNCGVDFASQPNPLYPILRNANIGYVVSSITSNMGGLIVNTDTYTFTDSRVWTGTPDQVAGLGFRTRTIASSLTGDTHLEQYIQTSDSLAGRSDYSEVKNGLGQYKHQSSTTYAVSSPLGQEWVSIASSSQTSYRDGLQLVTITKTPSYDSYGNITSNVTTGDGSVVTETDSYVYDTSRWILARPSTSKKDIDGLIVENTTYTYTGDTGVTITSMSGTSGASTTTITLDSFGKQQSVTDGLGRTTSYQYDSVVHNYPTKVTNPAKYSVTKTYDTSLGLELTAMDANGGIMTKRYDNKGRLIEIIPPGSDSYVERYSYIDYDSGLYFNSVSKSIINPDGGETTASEYYDLLGRSIRKESPGVQNLSIVETTEYDAKGQVYRKSNPYLETLETPVYTTYTYNPYEGYVNRVDHPDSSYTTISYNGFNESSQTYASDASLIQSQDLVKNAKGQTLSRTIDGKTITYQYDAASRVTQVLDAMSGATTTVYDDAGRRKSVSDVNSGTVSYTYDLVGNIKTQTDARNTTTTFTYDNLNRPTGVSYSNGDTDTIFRYDEGGSSQFALGRLTSVVDAAGTLQMSYDIRGNQIYEKRHIDDLDVIFRREYDVQNRLSSITYPDGTKVYEKYATTGHFSGVTMDTADGSSKGYTVGKYTGPVVDNNQFKIIRETGNGVKQEIQYDPIKRIPVGVVTKLGDGHIESAVSYTYDQRRNITQIADTIVNGRTQDFVYDTQNRLTQAKGKYGQETYTYSDNGNLTQRGNFTLAYGDANHKHAVTAVTSPSTGTFNYTYDASGNMISRNGDTHTYNAQNKLTQIDTVGGDKLTYLYDAKGHRIKKTSKTSGIVSYSFNEIYEITRTPGQPDKHTLYFKGLHGDTFSQMTRNDAQLVTKSPDFFDVAKFTGIFPFTKGDAFPPNLNGERSSSGVEMTASEIGSSIVTSINSVTGCQDIAGSCFDYYKNTAKFYYLQGAVKVASVIYTVEYDVFVWILLVVMLYLVYLLSNKKTVIEQRADIVDSTGSPTKPVEMTTSDKSFISIAAFRLRSMTGLFYDKQNTWFAKRTLSVTPLLTIAILFTFTQCGFVGGKTKGNAPWLLLASGINGNTQSVDDTSNGSNSSGGGGGGGTSLVPVTGMFFLHPDHLGSITMITDGNGNLIAGGNNGGKSHISYKPYGEIDRTDSSGPDISKFKFTGQEEDKESGLMYYKARYYDPSIGRFLQADSMVFPDRTMGMNRYMYVEGNPTRFTDGTGNSTNYSHMFGQIVGHMAGGAQWASGGLARAGDTYNAFTGNRKYQGKNDFKRSDIGKINGGKAWDSIVGKDGFFGGLGIAIGWNRVEKYWSIQKTPYREDWKRHAIKQLVQDEICNRYGGNSPQCIRVKLMNQYDLNHQRRHYLRQRDFNFASDSDTSISIGVRITPGETFSENKYDPIFDTPDYTTDLYPQCPVYRAPDNSETNPPTNMGGSCKK